MGVHIAFSNEGEQKIRAVIKGISKDPVLHLHGERGGQVLYSRPGITTWGTVTGLGGTSRESQVLKLQAKLIHGIKPDL